MIKINGISPMIKNDARSPLKTACPLVTHLDPVARLAMEPARFILEPARFILEEARLVLDTALGVDRGYERARTWPKLARVEPVQKRDC